MLFSYCDNGKINISISLHQRYVEGWLSAD